MLKLDTHSNETALIGRVLYAAMFVLYGYFKITAFAGTTAYMARQGLPAPALFAALAVLFELVFGLLLLVGYQTRLMGLALGIYCIVAALIAHTHWGDANQMAHFWKDMSIAGGGFALAAIGGGLYSIDAKRA
jgi:putative oxidoreductase